MTVRADTAGGESWRFEQDEYGDPVIFHRHQLSDERAQVIGRGPERMLVQCSACMQYLELEAGGRREPPWTDVAQEPADPRGW